MVGDQFGRSVAISDNTVVVGAYSDDHVGGADAGSAFVFTRVGTVWSQQQKLGEGVAENGDFFGSSVAVTGDDLVAGAPHDDHNGGTDSGSAVPYQRSGGLWTAQNTLHALALPARTQNYFGRLASMSDGVLVAGSNGERVAGVSQAGAARVFVGSGTTWGQQARLTAPVPGLLARFGVSVAAAGNTIVVGAQRDDHAGRDGAGSAYVFVRFGAAWGLQAQLTASDAEDGDGLGISVAISANTIVVGAFSEDGAGLNRGAAYVFVRSGNAWSLVQQLTPENHFWADRFGSAVAVDHGTVVSAASGYDFPTQDDTGAVYVFEPETPTLPFSDGFESGDTSAWSATVP